MFWVGTTLLTIGVIAGIFGIKQDDEEVYIPAFIFGIAGIIVLCISHFMS